MIQPARAQRAPLLPLSRGLSLGALLALVACAGSSSTEDCDPDQDGIQSLVELWPDADGDGYTAGSSELQCVGDSLPPGFAAAPTEEDCDDSSAGIFPGATDIVGDGTDQDCDGADAADTLTADATWVDSANPACQDDTIGSQSAPNCTIEQGALFVNPGGTIYIAGGSEYVFQIILGGRTYSGGYDPTDWSPGYALPTVVNQGDSFVAGAIVISGESGGQPTTLEGLSSIGSPTSEWGSALFIDSSGTIILRDLVLDGGGAAADVSFGLFVLGGDVSISDSVVDGGQGDTCFPVYVKGGSLVVEDTLITGCTGASTVVAFAVDAGEVEIRDLTVALEPGPLDITGLAVSGTGAASLTGVHLITGGSDRSVGLSVSGADARVELASSELLGAEGGAAVSLGALVENGGTLIAASSVFYGGGAEDSLAIDARSGTLMVVNSLVMGGSTAMNLESAADVTLVANNVWSEQQVVLASGAAETNDLDELNDAFCDNCDLGDPEIARPNTAQDPEFVDAASGSFALTSGSALVDAGVDPGQYGLLVDRDIEGGSSPRDGNGDGTDWWDVGPFEQ